MNSSWLAARGVMAVVSAGGVGAVAGEAAVIGEYDKGRQVLVQRSEGVANP